MGQAALFHRRVDTPHGRRGIFVGIPPATDLLAQAVECVRDGVAITARSTDEDPLRIVHCNGAFSALLNRFETGTAGRGRNRPPFDLAGDGPLINCLRESHCGEGEFSREISPLAPDGARAILHVHSRPTWGKAEGIAHRIAVVRDATGQTLMEEAFRRNERLAGVGFLGVGIAHEISNPVGSALLAAETALEIKDLPEAAGQFEACLRNVVVSMDRCARIVRTLLRYSRHEPTEKQACSINDVVAQALEQARPYGLTRGAEMRVDIDADVPLVPMNPLEIELVLLNLIRNAVESGTGPSIVHVRTSRIKQGVRTTISDNGRGMNEEQLAHVFDPLYTTRRKYGGCGIGMSIAKGIVENHEGQLEVRSRPGKGTTVIVDLPIAAL